MIRPDQIDATMAEYGVGATVVPMRERPKATGEWLSLEAELRREIAALKTINEGLARQLKRHDDYGKELNAEANTRVTELEGKLQNYRIAIIAMGAVAVMLILGFVKRML